MQAHYVGTKELAKNELQEIFKTRPSDYQIFLTGGNWISRTKRVSSVEKKSQNYCIGGIKLKRWWLIQTNYIPL